MPVSDYAPLFEAAGKQYNVDPQLLASVASVESSGDPKAVSPAGAQGLMQLMPATAKALGVADPFDPTQAIPAAAKLLAQNLDRYGTPDKALMAYNAGTDPARWNNPETQGYVPKIIAAFKSAIMPSAQAAEAKPGEAIPKGDAASAIFGPLPSAAPASDGVSTVTVTAKAPTGTQGLDATMARLRAGQPPAASAEPSDAASAVFGPLQLTPPAGTPVAAPPPAPAATTPQAPAQPSWLDRTLNTTVGGLAALQHGLTLGLDRPVNALANAAINYVSPGTGTRLQQAEDQSRQQFETEHPIAAPVLTAVGSMPTYATGEGILASAVPKMVGAGFLPSVVNGASRAAQGAVTGGIAGYGLSGGTLPGALQGAAFGGLAPGVSALAGKAANLVKAGARLAVPIPATTNSLANAIVDKFAGTPLARLDYSPLVPGSQPTLAEAAGIPGISRLQNGLADSDPVANNLLAARAQANAAARADALNAARGNESDLQSAVIQRDAITPGKVFANKQPTNAQPVVDEIKSILGGTGGGRTSVQSALGKLQGTLTDADGNLLPATSDPEYLYNSVRKQIGDQLDKANLSDASGRQAARELLQVRDKLDDAIETGAPGFAQYRADYAAASRPIDAMKWLQSQNLTDAQGNITLQKVQTALRNLGKQTSVVTKGVNDAASVTAEQRQTLEAIRDDLLRSQGINLSKSVGSNTFKNAATDYVLGQALPGPAASLVGKALDPRLLGLGLGHLTGQGWLGEGAGYGIGQAFKSFGDMRNAQVRNRLTEIMLDPSLYTPGRGVSNPLLSKLQPYVAPVGIGLGNPLLQNQKATP